MSCCPLIWIYESVCGTRLTPDSLSSDVIKADQAYWPRSKYYGKGRQVLKVDLAIAGVVFTLIKR